MYQFTSDSVIETANKQSHSQSRVQNNTQFRAFRKANLSTSGKLSSRAVTISSWLNPIRSQNGMCTRSYTLLCKSLGSPPKTHNEVFCLYICEYMSNSIWLIRKAISLSYFACVMKKTFLEFSILNFYLMLRYFFIGSIKILN